MRLLCAGATVAVAMASPAVPSASAAPPAAERVARLTKQAPGLRADVLRLALEASTRANEQGLVKRPELLTVIDYSLPSTRPRLFTFDLRNDKLMYLELVAHGKNSGDNLSTRFSNTPESKQTSLGLFVTSGTYVGSNGYSLRLRGLEPGVNDQAHARAIVMHGAPYVSFDFIKRIGRLGRSWGCPAVRKEISREMIDKLAGGSPIFAYYPDRHWLSTSRFLAGAASLISAR